MNITRSFVLCAIIQLTPAAQLGAQRPTDDLALRAAVVRAVQQDAPPTPIILASYAPADTAVNTRLGALLGLRVLSHLQSTHPRAYGDTVVVRIQIESATDSSAVATAVLSGALSKPSPNGPTSWFVMQRADLVRKNGIWVVTKLTTTFES